jgi:hypothetical protein
MSLYLLDAVRGWAPFLLDHQQGSVGDTVWMVEREKQSLNPKFGTPQMTGQSNQRYGGVCRVPKKRAAGCGHVLEFIARELWRGRGQE